MKCHAEIVGNEARGTMRELVQFLGGDPQQLIIVDRWSQGSDPSFRPLISEKFSTWSLVQLRRVGFANTHRVIDHEAMKVGVIPG